MTNTHNLFLIVLFYVCLHVSYGEFWQEVHQVQNVFSLENPEFFVGKKQVENYTMCDKHISEYLNQLQKPWQAVLPGTGGVWAWRMFDATGKFPDGVLRGNSRVLGSVHGCITVEVERPDQDKELDPFKGKYVLMNIYQDVSKSQRNNGALTSKQIGRMPIFFPSGAFLLPYLYTAVLKIGLCLPSSCSNEEILTAVRDRLEEVSPTLKTYMTGPVVKDPEIILDAGDVAMITFMGILAALLTAGTALDCWHLYHPLPREHVPLWKTFLLGFGLYTNSKRLADTTIQKRGDHIGCIDGIRFLSMSWVVLGHVYSNAMSTFPINNSVDFGPILDSFAFQAVVNAFPSVDSFFFLSGALLAYLTLKELDKTKGGGPTFWAMFYIHRYLRLTGVYAFIVCLHMTLYKHVLIGPGSEAVLESQRCRDSWWRNLLYINNFGSGEGENFAQCVGQTWYLSNDMQMFLITPFIIYPLWRWKIPGLIIAGTMTAASGLIPAVLTYQNDWPATVLFDTGTTYFEWNYVKPWCRFSPYIVGILLGYLLHTTKNKNVKLSPTTNLWGWAAATGIGVGVIYGLNAPKRMIGQVPLSVAENVLYGGFHRMAWAVALGWVVFACTKGYGGYINNLLCWGGFVPLSRLSYIIYLVHMTVINIFASASTFSFEVGHMIMTYINLAILGYSVVFSAIIFVCVEMPWLSSEKLFFSLILGFQHRKANAK